MLSRRLAYTILLLLVTCSLSAQRNERKDSLVRLLGCNELQQKEEYGISYRKALGNARFEHNSTKLLCDTAIWNINQNVIRCYGHVKIIQNRTVLSSSAVRRSMRSLKSGFCSSGRIRRLPTCRE